MDVTTAAVAAAAAEHGVGSGVRRSAHMDDAPMTPVVYLVLWTSIAVGCLRGYAMNSTLAARVAPSYTLYFSGQHQAELQQQPTSPYCTNGVDGLPGSSWYEAVISIVTPVLAPFLAALFVQRCGRKAGIMLGCGVVLTGQVLLASSHTLIQLYLGQACVTAASDVLFLSVALQCIEVASTTARGRFLLVHIVGFALGSCVVAIIGYFIANQDRLGWRLLFSMGSLPALAVLLVTPWLYETPHSLIERGRYAEGWEALREIRGPFYDDTYTEFMSIVRAAAAAPKGFWMFVDIVRMRIYWPAICVGVALAVVAVLLDPVSRSYVTYQSLTRSGLSFNNAVLMSALSLHGSYAVGALISVVLVDRVGRLPLLRASSALALAAVTALVVSAYVVAHRLSVSVHALHIPPRDWALAQLATLSVMAAGNGIAWSSTAWVIVCESQSLAVRPAAVAICIAAFNLSASVLETKLLCLLKLMYYMLVLAVSVVALVLAFGFVPETGRVSLEDISGLYAKHWWWGRVLRPQRRRPCWPQKGSSSRHLPPGPGTSTGAGAGAGAAAGAAAGAGAGAAAGASAGAGWYGSPAAAAADDSSLAGDTNRKPQADAQVATPFSTKRAQEASRESSTAVEDDPKTAQAVAAAARIALAGAASSVPPCPTSSQGLQHGRSSLLNLRLGGRRRSSQLPESTVAVDAVDQLASELGDE